MQLSENKNDFKVVGGHLQCINVHLFVFIWMQFNAFLFNAGDSVLSFGGGPAVNHLYMCAICQVEMEALAKRRKMEIDTFIKVNACILPLHKYVFMLCNGCSVNCFFFLSVAEQRVSGWGGSNSDHVHQHAVVQRVGELCEGQRQWYDSVARQIQLYIKVVHLSKILFIICFVRGAWSHRQQ